MRQSVLVVEDEADVASLLKYNLGRAGYEVHVAETGTEGLQKLADKRPDAVLLDIMLPGISGYEVCQRIRKEGAKVAVVMLTAKGEPSERIKGFEVGADDYVTKPFSTRELLLRLKAVLRRLQPPPNRETVVVDAFEVDRSALEVRVDGERMDLTTIEFKLLSLLIERRGRVQKREELLHEVWGYNNAIDTRTVDTHIRRLREKLGDRSARLETARGEGYRFKAVE